MGKRKGRHNISIQEVISSHILQGESSASAGADQVPLYVETNKGNHGAIENAFLRTAQKEFSEGTSWPYWRESTPGLHVGRPKGEPLGQVPRFTVENAYVIHNIHIINAMYIERFD